MVTKILLKYRLLAFKSCFRLFSFQITKFICEFVFSLCIEFFFCIMLSRKNGKNNYSRAFKDNTVSTNLKQTLIPLNKLDRLCRETNKTGFPCLTNAWAIFFWFFILFFTSEDREVVNNNILIMVQSAKCKPTHNSKKTHAENACLNVVLSFSILKVL